MSAIKGVYCSLLNPRLAYTVVYVQCNKLIFVLKLQISHFQCLFSIMMLEYLACDDFTFQPAVSEAYDFQLFLIGKTPLLAT